MPGELKPQSGELKITRGRLEEVRVYEITESELDTLEQGSLGSLHLNFAIFLVSIASGFLIPLLDSTQESERVFIAYTIIVVVGYLVGAFLFIQWLMTRKDLNKTIKKIRDRLESPEE